MPGEVPGPRPGDVPNPDEGQGKGAQPPNGGSLGPEVPQPGIGRGPGRFGPGEFSGKPAGGDRPQPSEPQRSQEGGKSSKDNPAEQETVDAVASNLKEIMGEDNVGKVPISDDSSHTLAFVSRRVASGERRGGRNTDVIIRKEEMVVEGEKEDKRTTVDRYRLGTSTTQPTKLLVSTDTPEEYLESEISEYLARLEARSHLPESEQWQPATEGQAQELQTLVEELVTEAREGGPSKRELQEKVVTEFDRILGQSEGALVEYGDGREITYALEGIGIRFAYHEEDGSRHVSFIENQAGGAVAEKYKLKGGMPITLSRTALEYLDPRVDESLSVEASKEEVRTLTNALGRLSNEAIEQELATRAAVNSAAERLIASQGTWDMESESIAAKFEREAFTAIVRKSVANDVTAYTIAIKNKRLPASEEDVERQHFVQEPSLPLQVMNITYGTETIPPLEMASEGDKVYVQALLEELAK